VLVAATCVPSFLVMFKLPFEVSELPALLELLFSVLAGVTEELASLEPRKPPPIPMQATKAREAVIIAYYL